MREKLRMTPDQVLEQAVSAIHTARQYTDNVEFSAEDAGRSELDFLCRVIEAAIDAGATTINIPDTVGYNIPHQFGELIKQLLNRIPNADKAIFSVHCHNDLGLAVGNSLAAVLAGARQVECTINGLGERAGNASLEEVVMAVRTRRDVFSCDTRIDTTQIVPTSGLVSSVTGFPIQPNKAIVGANAFAHESGIHQDGVLKARETYEIMRAQDVGWSDNKIVMGKHSGRAALKDQLEKLGVHFNTTEALNAAFSRFKELADKKHEIFKEDLLVIANDMTACEAETCYYLVSSHVCSSTGEAPFAEVVVKIDGVEIKGSATGGGPVDAVFKAIASIMPIQTNLELYSVSNITSGTDSLGEVSVRLAKKDYIVTGHGADTDIVLASAHAYIDALNKFNLNLDREHPQYSGV
jgi:2-isopropylmalate synthase